MMYSVGRYGWDMARGMPWLQWLGPIAMIVFWALFVAALVMLIVYLARHRRSSGASGTALSILKERYARGEISKEEFEQKQKDIL
jgi:putative membrane protein